jgi:hypothetical protein
MAVGIHKAVHIDEAKVFLLVVGGATGSEGLRDEIVHLPAAFTREAEPGLDRLRRIAGGANNAPADRAGSWCLFSPAA